MRTSEAASRLARLQAVYYFISGVWPLIDIRTFEAVTGPKADRWLVKTVGALVAATGLGLAVASRRRPSPELALVAAGNAAALAVIDVVYVAKRRISPIYLLDAAAELPLAAGWLWLWRRGGLDGGH